MKLTNFGHNKIGPETGRQQGFLRLISGRADHVQRIYAGSQGAVAREVTAFVQSGGNKFIRPNLLRDRAVTAGPVLVYENIAVPVLPVEAGGF